jgi:mRNA interferase HigB
VRIFTRGTLQKFWTKHPSSAGPLRAWFAEVRRAAWRTPQDIKNRYASADFLRNNRVVFDICGNNFRMVVWVKYDGQAVMIRFLGTHAEYDKIDAETV